MEEAPIIPISETKFTFSEKESLKKLIDFAKDMRMVFISEIYLYKIGFTNFFFLYIKITFKTLNFFEMK